jgi:energy-coupling factor transporter transmembrane protein EcfT
MDLVWIIRFACSARFYDSHTHALPRRPLEDSMQDLLYIALTIVAFGVLWLIVKGVERFER